MFGALFRKQMMESNSWLLLNKKKGQRRSRVGMILLGLFYLLLFVGLGFGVFMLGSYLASMMSAIDMGWLYYVLMGMMSIMLGVFGSVFNTYASLYKAKDNEFLLSMPIPSSMIMSVKLIGVWVWSLVYESIVFVPSMIAYWIEIEFSAGALIAGLATWLVISVFILTLTCILGWCVAKIGSKLKNKSFVTVFLSLFFIAVYYYFYFRASELIQLFIANALNMGAKIKGYMLPLYWMGKGATGDSLALLYNTLLVAAAFGVVAFVMTRTFRRLATASAQTSNKHSKAKVEGLKSVSKALLGREAKRFTSNATYMLNCALATILLPILGIAALIKQDWLGELIGEIGMSSVDAMLICSVILCMSATMNYMTAPSVSLEGKTLWLLQSLPVDMWAVLKAKLRLHLILTEVPVIFASACIAIAMGATGVEWLWLLLLPALTVLLCASFGLLLGIKMPNLNWTDETVPIKRSGAVVICIFAGWGFVGTLAAVYLLVGYKLTANGYLSACAVLVGVLSAICLRWLKTRGSRTMQKL